MKEYIVLTINENNLIFNYKTISNDEEKYVNKRVLYKDSFYYTLKYFKRKKENLIEDYKNKGINSLIITRLITFSYASFIIDALQIENLRLDFISTIDMEDYNLFLNNKSLKNIDCYFMASGIKEEFENNNVNIKTYNKRKISEQFMSQEQLPDKDSIYYRKIISIKEEYPGLIDDLTEFLKINYKLRAIHLYTYSKELITSIIDLVKNDESRNVVVFLHQKTDKGNFIENNFAWLKQLSKECREDYTCEFRIVYSDNFISKNLFKQLTFNNLKLMLILGIYISLVCIIIIKSYEYIEKMSVDELNEELSNTIAVEETTFDPEEITDDVEEELEEEPEALEPDDVNANLTKEQVTKKYTMTTSLAALRKKNKETVAYLIVKNTEISYPVVKHSDNNYYLKHDFYKNKTSMGWIYMDYRNSAKDLNDNTIMYGHSMLNGTMFGTLKKVLSSTWRNNEDNMIISLTTDKGELKFKIFSAYKVDYTTDYLVTNFSSKKEFTSFVKMIKKRSVFNSDQNVSYGDKILTLSTCTGSNNRRLVVHAVLLKEE